VASKGLDNQRANNADSEDFLVRLRLDGVVRHPDATLTPLSDGVSSEIFRVDDGSDTFVVKRALAKLRVKDHWTADVNRNHYEQMYIRYVSRFLPQAVPSLRPGDENRNYFAMEYLGPEFTNWKQHLLRGEALLEHAVRAASLLGRIHAQSTADVEIARQFDTTANFMQLRIDPYLLTTGRRHPDLTTVFEEEAQRLASARQCLVHGDFSPKNILVSETRLVLLDCEVAWYGDPAFDLAFLLAHFLLKGLYHTPRQVGLRGLAKGFWQRYLKEAGSAIDAQSLEPRVARLLLMLLLARIDGKSPVEYLKDPKKAEFVRLYTRTRILTGSFDLGGIISEWFTDLEHWKVG
jgi:5-methylthioribose kinase